MSDNGNVNFSPGRYVLDPVQLGLPPRQSSGPGVWLGHWNGSEWTRTQNGGIVLQSNYATFWDRFGYTLFDWLIIVVIGFISVFVLNFLNITGFDGSSINQIITFQQPDTGLIDDGGSWSPSPYSAGFFFAFVWFGYLLLCYMLMGRSLGQRIAGVKMLGIDGQQPSRGVLFFRAVGLGICIFYQLLWWVLVLSTIALPNNVTFLDKILDVWVVNKVNQNVDTPPINA